MKPFRAKLFALCGALAAVTSLNTHANAAGTVKGPANVLAGNILGVSGKVIVLAGIHVPFPAQACRRNTKPWACGLQSLRTLQQMAKGKPVTCRIVGKDAQSRLRGICRNANGELNTQMVRMGMALAAANAPAHLGKLQNIAKKSKRGLWSAEFIHPLEWRRGKRLAGMAIAFSTNARRNPIRRAYCILRQVYRATGLSPIPAPNECIRRRTLPLAPNLPTDWRRTTGGFSNSQNQLARKSAISAGHA